MTLTPPVAGLFFNDEADEINNPQRSQIKTTMIVWLTHANRLKGYVEKFKLKAEETQFIQPRNSDKCQQEYFQWIKQEFYKSILINTFTEGGGCPEQQACDKL
jgi:hypothetical protein